MLPPGHPSIRFQLIRLVAACVVPVWLVSAYLVYYAYTTKLSRINDDLLDDAVATAAIIDLELSRVQGALVSLATSPFLDRLDLEGFHRQSRQLLGAEEGHIVLADASGQELLNTVRPWGTPLPRRGNMRAVRAIFDKGQPVVSDLFVGAVSGRPLVSVDVPVVRQGKVIYDLSMSFSPRRFPTLLGTGRLPHGGYSALVDGNYITIARTLEPERSVGRPALPALRRAIAAARSGTSERRNLEGVQVMSSFCRSSRCGWTAIVAVPKASIMLETYRLMLWTIAAATVISLLGWALAYRIGHRIAHSIRSLVAPAVQIGRGEPVVCIGGQSMKETVEVSTALLEASNLIQGHIALQQEQQDALQQLNELLERRVEERTSALESALREQECFSYSVSHDLRAPLRHMNCYSSMLLEQHGEALNEEGRHFLHRIRNSARHLGLLIDNLLELSRINRTEFRPKVVNLSDETAAIVSMFRETEPDRKVEVVIEPGLTALGDCSMLKQLLQNLLGNAWKYSARRDVACIEFGSRRQGEETFFFVQDNGAGFDMAYVDRLFNAFERLHGTEFEGVGVGLATAQRVVERHGGRIWAEGEVGRGATFYFTLPEGSA